MTTICRFEKKGVKEMETKKYVEVGKCRTNDNLFCFFYDMNSTKTIKDKSSAFCTKIGENVSADFRCSFYLEVEVKEQIH